MKTLIQLTVVVFAGFCCGCSSTGGHTETPTHSAPIGKGYIEFYSWQADGSWHFALLPATNRKKPESMVKSASLTLAEVEKRFTEYSAGERISWQSEAGFELPESEVIQRLESAAQKSKLSLTVP